VNWEVGVGTVTAGTPNTLSRTTVYSNSAGTTALINFAAGTKTVFCDVPASQSVFKDANGIFRLGTTSTTYDARGNIIVGGLASSGLIAISSGGPVALYQSSTAGGYAGTISNHPFEIRTNDTARLTLGSTGSVKMASATEFSFASTTAAGAQWTVGFGNFQVSANGVDPLALQRTTSDGSIVTFWRQNTGVGTISVTTTATAYNTSSDGRLKTNVRALDPGDVIDRLEPVTFFWHHAPAVRGTGFIAQDLYRVVPEAVTPGDRNLNRQPGEAGFEPWQMDAAKLIPWLVAELQSVRKRLAALESRA
jgi:hypothetical protein